MAKPSEKLWGGRFDEEQSKTLQEINSSINIDKCMCNEDILGSIAYSKALLETGLINSEEQIQIENGLSKISEEWKNGDFKIQFTDEDIHSANERRLKELIGSTGGKLHTGRSRNDQVATDFRMWVLNDIPKMQLLLKNLIKVLLKRAEAEIDILMPGYTHLQRAQVIRWSHWLMSHAWSMKKDFLRLQEVAATANECPLGSGALAGNPFNVDRIGIANQLGFFSITPNSLLAVADRDFVAEYLFWISLTGIHLSKMAEDLILFSTAEFGFVTLSDAFATGSSLMPQKKNPDGLELIRGKSGRLIGNLTGFLSTLKSLPSTYNKDLQDDKEVLFSSISTIKSLIETASGTVESLKVNKEKCYKALTEDMLSTDIAYYLVRKGIPFRTAHEKAGEVVKKAEQLMCSLSSIPLKDLQSISPEFSEDIGNVWSFESSVEQYKASGGTAKQSVMEQIMKLKLIVDNV